MVQGPAVAAEVPWEQLLVFQGPAVVVAVPLEQLQAFRKPAVELLLGPPFVVAKSEMPSGW